MRQSTVTQRRARAPDISRGLRLILPAAVILPLLVLAGVAWLSWTQAWRSSEEELTRTADAGAEYARRVLDGLLLRADRANEVLVGLTDDAIRAREGELHAAFRALAERTRDVGALHVFAQDRTGASLVSGEIFPVPPPSVTFEGREYAAVVRDPHAPAVHLGKIFVGKVLLRPFFSVARRREDSGNETPAGEYDGLVVASADVNAVGAGLLRLVPGGAEGSPDVLALVRADGHILARSAPMDAPLPPLRLTNPVAQGILDGHNQPDRALILRRSGVDGVPRLAALRRVDGWPAYVSVARPRSAILARWREAVALQFAFGFPAMAALVGLALLARRSARTLAAANDSLERRVAERTASLEERDARLRLAMSTAALGIVEWDLDGNTLRVDAGTEAITRGLLPADRALSVHGPERSAWVSRIHPDDQRRREAQVVGLRTGEVDTIQGDYRVRLPPRGPEKDQVDEEAWITYRGSVSARDPTSGRVTRIIDVVQDVTQRKRIEEALVADQARLKAALHAARLGVWERHLPSATATWDERAAEIWDGLTADRSSSDLADWLERVHPEDKAARAQDILAVTAPGGRDSYSIEFRFRTADGRWKRVAVHGTAVERDPETGRAVRLVGVVQDLTEVRAAEVALRESEERLRLATEGGGVGIWELDLISGQGNWSREAVLIFGIERATFSATDWIEAVHPEDRGHAAVAWQRAVADGVPYEVEFRAAIVAPDGGARWVLSRGRVERGLDGAPVRGVGIMLDVTARRRAEEHRELLLREVDHRAKNALAVVQAALRLTPKDDGAAYAKAVEARVQALARAHTLLAEGRWQGASLRTLVEAELAPFLPTCGRDAPRVSVNGPTLTLAPAVVQALSMALHELATNAVKYGALSVPDGLVAVSWTAGAPGEALCLRWEERRGPGIAIPPSHRGFGSRVVEATVRGQLGGTVERHWEAEGLVCKLTIPLTKAIAAGMDAAAAR